MANPGFTEDDRVELIADYGNMRPALKKGRKGKVVTFPIGKKEREVFCYVKFDGYTPGVVTVDYNKPKKI